MDKGKKIEILECTVRDGSYSIDFKFTLQDTALLAKLLSDIGFKYIEVGHGLGLGASRAGKGEAPWPDDEAVSAAKSAVGSNVSIGVFCIPGIASFEDMKKARDKGLDFVRIGQNAPEIATTLPYIKEAIKLDIMPFVNFMKSYGVSPEEFGKKAKMVADEGAQVVYVVDSAGGMFPEQTARYFDAIRENSDVKMGFHSHNNLHMAVANSVEAVRHGATYVDATLYGLGRSAGNAPTEVVVGVFKNLGYDIGDIDLFQVMDIAEAYMKPLISNVQMYDMMSVAAGYSLFHSSFLPKVAKMARKYGVELRRLVAAMGKADPVNCPDDVLESLAQKLSKEKTAPIRTQPVLISFNEPGFERERITSTMESAQVLIEGVMTTAAKRNTRPALDLVATSEPAEDVVVSEFAISDEAVVLGRVVFGGWQILEQTIELARGKISVFLIDINGGSWAPIEEIIKRVEAVTGKQGIFIYSSRALQTSYLVDHLVDAVRDRQGALVVLSPGKDFAPVLPYITGVYRNIYLYRPSDELVASLSGEVEKCIILSDPGDWKHLNLKSGVIYFPESHQREDVERLMPILSEDSVIISARALSAEVIRLLEREPRMKTVILERNNAYRGQLHRWLQIDDSVRSILIPTEI